MYEALIKKKQDLAPGIDRSEWVVTSSGARANTHPLVDYAEQNIVDNEIGNHLDAFVSNGAGLNQWLQVDFGREIQNVDRVLVVKRAEVDGVDIAARFDAVEVRIGNDAVPDGLGAVNLTGIVDNAVCGVHYVEDVSRTAVTIRCATPLTGRYVTFQNGGWNHLSMDEVFINTL